MFFTLTIKQTVVNKDIINFTIFPDLNIRRPRCGNKAEYFLLYLITNIYYELFDIV